MTRVDLPMRMFHTRGVSVAKAKVKRPDSLPLTIQDFRRLAIAIANDRYPYNLMTDFSQKGNIGTITVKQFVPSDNYNHWGLSRVINAAGLKCIDEYEVDSVEDESEIPHREKWTNPIMKEIDGLIDGIQSAVHGDIFSHSDDGEFKIGELVRARARGLLVGVEKGRGDAETVTEKEVNKSLNLVKDNMKRVLSSYQQLLKERLGSVLGFIAEQKKLIEVIEESNLENKTQEACITRIKADIAEAREVQYKLERNQSGINRSLSMAEEYGYKG